MNEQSKNAWIDFRQIVEKNGGVILEKFWRGSRAKHRCVCANDHVFYLVPNRVNRDGYKCQECQKNKQERDIPEKFITRIASLPPNRDMSWQDHAECRGLPLEDFFSTMVKVMRKSQQVCDRCPVKTECLIHALWEQEEHGVWGGMGPDERKAIRRRVRRRRANMLSCVTTEIGTKVAG